MKSMNFKIFSILLFFTFMQVSNNDAKAIGKEFFFELSPIFFLYSGGGGSIGSEKNHWQTGLSFSTFNPQNFYFRGKIDVTGSLHAIRAMTIEPFTKFYFSKERKWLYLGLNFVPEIYQVEDKQSKEKTMQINAYAKPKIGLRWFPFKRILYIDLSYALSIRILDTKTTQIGQGSIIWQDFVASPEATIGIRIK